MPYYVHLYCRVIRQTVIWKVYASSRGCNGILKTLYRHYRRKEQKEIKETLQRTLDSFHGDAVKTAMDFFDSQYFRINKFLLSFTGLWPYQKAATKFLTVLFWALCIIMSFVPQVYSSLDNNEFVAIVYTLEK